MRMRKDQNHDESLCSLMASNNLEARLVCCGLLFGNNNGNNILQNNKKALGDDAQTGDCSQVGLNFLDA